MSCFSRELTLPRPPDLAAAAVCVPCIAAYALHYCLAAVDPTGERLTYVHTGSLCNKPPDWGLQVSVCTALLHVCAALLRELPSCEPQLSVSTPLLNMPVGSASLLCLPRCPQQASVCSASLHALHGCEPAQLAVSTAAQHMP